MPLPKEKLKRSARAARIIRAEGEQELTRSYRNLLDTIGTGAARRNLRRLQTRSEIGVENNTTIVAMLPSDSSTLRVRSPDYRLPMEQGPSNKQSTSNRRDPLLAHVRNGRRKRTSPCKLGSLDELKGLAVHHIARACVAVLNGMLGDLGERFRLLEFRVVAQLVEGKAANICLPTCLAMLF